MKKLEPSKSTVLEATEGNRPIPIIETIDMGNSFVGAGGQGANILSVELSKPFVEVARLIVIQDWDAANFDFTEFSDGSALTLGINIALGGVNILPDPIKQNMDYMKYSYDVAVVIDTKPATKHTTLGARFSFGKFMGLEGRGINLLEQKLSINSGDDLTGIGNAITWTFEGWTWGR